MARHTVKRRRKTTCDGKERLDTWDDAQTKAQRVMHQTGAARLTPYYCRFCHGFHIGRHKEKGGKGGQT